MGATTIRGMMQREQRDDVPTNTFQSWLQEQMAHKGWKHHSELVKAAKVPQSAVSQWLLDEERQPSIKNARKVARVFGISMLEMLVIAGYISASEAQVQPSGEPTLRGATLHQLLLQAQIRSAELEREMAALREGREPEEFLHGDIPGLSDGGAASDGVAAENGFF